MKTYFDALRQLNYVIHDGKKMYFKKSWTKKDIQESYANLLREQDINSPHRYTTADFNVMPNDIVADVGAAEGIFSLPLVERVSKLYLFENDVEWIEALEATFSPWGAKVEIIKKFVSNIDGSEFISLDNFASINKITFDFIKVDVDGAEELLLEGAKTILTNNSTLKIAICTYHKQNDEHAFRTLLTDYGFNTHTSSGYMIFLYDPTLTEPFLRRGVLRATKK